MMPILKQIIAQQIDINLRVQDYDTAVLQGRFITEIDVAKEWNDQKRELYKVVRDKLNERESKFEEKLKTFAV